MHFEKASQSSMCVLITLIRNVEQKCSPTAEVFENIQNILLFVS